MLEFLKEFAFKLQELKSLNLIPILAFFFYNIKELRKTARSNDFLFLTFFLIIHLITTIYKTRTLHKNPTVCFYKTQSSILTVCFEINPRS